MVIWSHGRLVGGRLAVAVFKRAPRAWCSQHGDNLFWASMNAFTGYNSSMGRQFQKDGRSGRQ